MARTNHRIDKDKAAKRPESPSHEKRRQERKLQQSIEDAYYSDELDEVDEYEEFERFEKMKKR